MKKKAILAAVLAATTLTTATAFASAKSFKDVPMDHWSYDALDMLAKDGVIEGYGDGTFRGDQPMNRYEMAEIVAKAAEKYGTADLKDKGAITKLAREYADELKNMDVRLTAVENDVAELRSGMSSFKWYADARMRYAQNKAGDAVDGLKNLNYGAGNKEKYNAGKAKNQNELRLRLGFYGEPAPNVSVNGRLKVENVNIARENCDAGQNSGHTASKDDEKMAIDRLQLDWKAKNGFTVSAGRNEVSLGQGLIYWENPIDSVMVRKDFGDKASLLLGAGDTSCTTWDNEAGFATFANLSAKVSPAVTVTAAYFNQNSDAKTQHHGFDEWSNVYYYQDKLYSTKNNLQQLSLGVNAQLARKWNLIAEGVHNNVDAEDVITIDNTGASDYPNQPSTHKNGFWTRLTYGKLDPSQAKSWQVYGDYFALGGLANNSSLNGKSGSSWVHRLNVAGGNGYGGKGARGWGLGASYMLAKNTNLELAYYKVKPYDKNTAGFDEYDDMGFASLCYSF